MSAFNNLFLFVFRVLLDQLVSKVPSVPQVLP